MVKIVDLDLHEATAADGDCKEGVERRIEPC